MQMVENVGRHSNRLEQRLTRRVSGWLDRHQPPETVVLLGTSLLVGLGAGLGAVVFRWLIDQVHTLSFDGLGRALSFLGDYVLILAPALGGLIVGPLIYFFAREAKGHGVPEVMEAVALRGGRIRPIVVVIKSLASSITIGSAGPDPAHVRRAHPQPGGLRRGRRHRRHV
jgi:CIC family chloride channel protein